jgi:hypothetical protein
MEVFTAIGKSTIESTVELREKKGTLYGRSAIEGHTRKNLITVRCDDDTLLFLSFFILIWVALSGSSQGRVAGEGGW